MAAAHLSRAAAQLVDKAKKTAQAAGVRIHKRDLVQKTKETQSRRQERPNLEDKRDLVQKTRETQSRRQTETQSGRRHKLPVCAQHILFVNTKTFCAQQTCYVSQQTCTCCLQQIVLLTANMFCEHAGLLLNLSSDMRSRGQRQRSLGFQRSVQ